MREILFRGKRLYDGEWVYGFYVHYADRWGRDKDLIQSLDIESGEFGFLHEVDPETVGQYTGLLDKNGKRIFEGDIVIYDNTPYNAYGHKVIGEIVWHKWAWKCRYKEYGSTYHYAIGAEDFFGPKSEVIGNIHDNPELMRAQS